MKEWKDAEFRLRCVFSSDSNKKNSAGFWSDRNVHLEKRQSNELRQRVAWLKNEPRVYENIPLHGFVYHCSGIAVLRSTDWRAFAFTNNIASHCTKAAAEVHWKFTFE